MRVSEIASQAVMGGFGEGKKSEKDIAKYFSTLIFRSIKKQGKSSQFEREQGAKVGLRKDHVLPPATGKNSLFGSEADTVYKNLSAFISAQQDEFTSAQLWNASLVESDDRTAYHAAVRKLVEQGILEVIEQPIGRRIGTYRRKSN